MCCPRLPRGAAPAACPAFPHASPSISPTLQWALLRRTTLGRLTSPIREPTVLEKWSPYEIALFESGICLTGKLFGALAALIKSKTVAECIEFFYVWKRSKNYAQWKATFRVPLLQT